MMRCGEIIFVGMLPQGIGGRVRKMDVGSPPGNSDGVGAQGLVGDGGR